MQVSVFVDSVLLVEVADDLAVPDDVFYEIVKRAALRKLRKKLQTGHLDVVIDEIKHAHANAAD